MQTRLTQKVKTSGCSAKFPPKILSDILASLPRFQSENVVAGFENAEDCAVFRVSGDLCAVESVDFFPPMLDDARLYGRIAAANALSDLYAMGVSPSFALSLLCFPSCSDTALMRDILDGGAKKAAEAGVPVIGGHTIADEIPKYGLCVTGFAPLKEIRRNNTVREGDVLVLTKPLGTGIAIAAYKGGLLKDASFSRVAEQMETLNREAFECSRGLAVSASTDVTGFGFLGHLSEMMSLNAFTAEINSASIPFLPEIFDFARFGVLPEGMYNNIDYVGDKVFFNKNIRREMRDILFSPETSGGLLLSLPEKDASAFLSRFRGAAAVGRIVKKGKHPITVM